MFCGIIHFISIAGRIEHSEETENEDLTSDSKPNTGLRGISRFATLAATISQWENENAPGPSDKNHSREHPLQSVSNKKTTCSPVTVQKRTKPVEVRGIVADVRKISPQKPRSQVEASKVDVRKKICVWDKAVVATLVSDD